MSDTSEMSDTSDMAAETEVRPRRVGVGAEIGIAAVWLLLSAVALWGVSLRGRLPADASAARHRVRALGSDR